jgi:hypothetical protein
MGKRSDDFGRVARGDAVSVDGPDGLYVVGTVEDIAPDGSVFWVREEGGHGRRMVHVTDRADVRRRGNAADAGAGSLEASSLPR